MSVHHTTTQPSKICVIGHTNVGKTSLMRTLLRDSDFGEVKNSSATTRHVSAVQILGNHQEPLVVLYDTPGLEDAAGVMDFLQLYTDGRADGVERLMVFLAAVDNQDERLQVDYSQEAKVIRSLLSADVALYVIDAREPVLSKYKDELAILANSGVPILPVFNFTSAANQPNAWREMLGRRALHISSSFDTVAFDFDNEMALWSNLSLLLQHDVNITTLKQQRHDNWQELLEQGSLLIADFLINVAAFSKKIDERSDPKPVLSAMQNAVRQAEQILQQQLLALYRFYQDTLNDDSPAITGEVQDIFDSQLLARYGIRTAGGSLAGMIIGAGIDVATLGTSLGLGTAIGGVLGGLLPNSNTLKDKALGIQTLNIDDATLTLLAARSQSLHYVLRHRGHASIDAIDNKQHTLPWQSNALPASLKKARTQPNYSSLHDNYHNKATLRRDLADDLAEVLLDHYQKL